MMVMIHGGAGVSHDYLRPEWDLLADSMRIVYYDQRGCGRSERQLPYSWRAHLDDLGRVVTAARERREKVVLAGSSWGTRLAILYAAEHPEQVSAVVLVGTPRWPDAESRRWREQLPAPIAWRLDSLEKGVLLREATIHDSLTFASMNLHIPPALAGRLATSGLCDDVLLATTASLGNLPKLREFRLGMPVLVASEVSDGTNAGSDLVWNELQASLSQGQRLEIPGGGHDPWFTRSKDFFPALMRFLKAVP
ncbi:MAG: hypothetical protein C0497_00150 [Gemmatimonas sp.]|nr:hypothetical protein [Gemmatimonas sp.]